MDSLFPYRDLTSPDTPYISCDPARRQSIYLVELAESERMVLVIEW